MDNQELLWEWIGKFYRDNNRIPTRTEVQDAWDSQNTRKVTG